MIRILFVFGTRPEAIKMAPLITEFKKYPDIFKSIVCLSGQHREMLDQVNNFFNIKGDYDLNLMKHNQTLFDITADGLKGLQTVLDKSKPDIVFVQGDTTTAFIGALAAFYKKIRVAHLEAGLRSFDKYSPYPEEINRKLISLIADIHFAPTEKAVVNLHNEGINENVYNVGNTVIDALFLGLEIIKSRGENKYYQNFKEIDFNKRIVLITCHRRESFGDPFKNICYAIKTVANKYTDAQFIYPVHLNPNVRTDVKSILSSIPNVFLIDPLDYPNLIWLMKKCFLVLTDSGGIQEEAPSLGKPVLVMRDVTERIEGVIAGTAKLVGTDKMKIVESIIDLFENDEHYYEMSNSINPYGDGQACKRVVNIIKDYIK